MARAERGRLGDVEEAFVRTHHDGTNEIDVGHQHKLVGDLHGGKSRASGQRGHDVVDTCRQGHDIGRVDGREHADSKVIAAELAIGVGVAASRIDSSPQSFSVVVSRGRGGLRGAE
jgi:hypothetical protein